MFTRLPIHAKNKLCEHTLTGYINKAGKNIPPMLSLGYFCMQLEESPKIRRYSYYTNVTLF